MISVTRESQVSYATLSKIKNKRIQFTIKKKEKQGKKKIKKKILKTYRNSNSLQD